VDKLEMADSLTAGEGLGRPGQREQCAESKAHPQPMQASSRSERRPPLDGG
jgi:hypothetical protein